MTTPHDPRPVTTTAAPAVIVTDYLTAFLAGDIEKARSLVREDFSFRAPLVEAAGTKAMFFAGAEHKASLIRAFRILRLWEDGDQVSTVYEIDVVTSAGAASMLLHEWHTVRNGQLASTTMIFDTKADAAQLLHDALMSPEGVTGR